MKMKKRLSKEDKISFIIKNELMMSSKNGFSNQPRDNDEFKEIRDQIKKYRIQLGLIKK